MARTILRPWRSVPWLLRSRYPEIEVGQPEALVLIGAGNRLNGRTSPQGEAVVERARRYLASLPPHHRLPLVLCVSGNRFGGKTESEALAAEVMAKIGHRLNVEVVVLDPPSESLAQQLGSLNGHQPLRDPQSLTHNTWENVQRVLDYCRLKRLRRIQLVCHPEHGTWALPLLRHSAVLSKHQLEVGLLNARPRAYDRASPLWRLRSAWRFYVYGVLAKGKQLLNGWCVLPYIRTHYRT